MLQDESLRRELPLCAHLCLLSSFMQRKKTCKLSFVATLSSQNQYEEVNLSFGQEVWLPDRTDQLQIKDYFHLKSLSNFKFRHRQQTSSKVKWWSSILTLLLLSQIQGTVSFVPQPEAPHLWPLAASFTYPLTSADIKQPWPKNQQRHPDYKKKTQNKPHVSAAVPSWRASVCVLNQVWALPERERNEGGRASCLSPRGAQNGPHLPPYPLSNWVMVGGGGVFVWVVMRRRWWWWWGFNTPRRGSLTGRQW